MSDNTSGTGQPSFDIAALARWMHQQGLLDRAELTARSLTGGQSNPTFRLTSGSQQFVLRKKPPGPLLPSAHAVDREYKVMKALQGSDVPVPKVFAFCDDDSVVGTPFFLMEFLDGRVMVDQSLPGMSPLERRAIYEEMNRIIAALHQIDPAAVGLADFGRAGNYFGRQIARWSRQYQETRTEEIPALDALIEWLPAHIPPGDQTTIVHAAFRWTTLGFTPSGRAGWALLAGDSRPLGTRLPVSGNT